ncbi:xyloside xylosyltransferase 1-like isoform X2 [Watersipora subatra]|uniref:xyloside xylosyltransferase 1-like isoform X2 n=1 Tax=Watersipora subatra TaxID=2589382 RepID=UPI00355B0B2D
MITQVLPFTLSSHSRMPVVTTSFKKSSETPIIFVIIGDAESQSIAESTLSKATAGDGISTAYKIASLDAELLARELHAVVEPMQRYFSSKPGAYYSDSLFFLSIAIHRVLPDSINKVIMLDADLKFRSDIADLYSLFDEFTDENIIGIARENQPVYRHTFNQFRTLNPGTRVGEPPPDGLTGFNSGVLLLNLAAMRESALYNSLINEATLLTLAEKYIFKGHLGDQDFFTLISMEHEEMFYILPCGWNKQLCTWWQSHGYAAVFDLYFNCAGKVHIYHGNCNTWIPPD